MEALQSFMGKLSQGVRSAWKVPVIPAFVRNVSGLGLICTLIASFVLGLFIAAAASKVVVAPFVMLVLAIFGDVPIKTDQFGQSMREALKSIVGGNASQAEQVIGGMINKDSIFISLQKVVEENAGFASAAFGVVIIALLYQNWLRYSSMIKVFFEGQYTAAFRHFMAACAPGVTIVFVFHYFVHILHMLKGPALGVAMFFAGIASIVGGSPVFAIKIATISVLLVYFVPFAILYRKVVLPLMMHIDIIIRAAYVCAGKCLYRVSPYGKSLYMCSLVAFGCLCAIALYIAVRADVMNAQSGVFTFFLVGVISLLVVICSVLPDSDGDKAIDAAGFAISRCLSSLTLSFKSRQIWLVKELNTETLVLPVDKSQ